MTIADSALTNPEPEPIPGSVQSPAFSLNEVFQERMRKAKDLHEQLHVVVRCEQLPHIEGNREEIGKLFEKLLTTEPTQEEDANVFLIEQRRYKKKHSHKIKR